MQGTILGQICSNSSGLNVYAQSSEPSKKEGIWIDTQQLPKYEKMEDIPYDFHNGAVVSVEEDIYLIGSTSNPKYVYKYSISENSYIKMAEAPINLNGCGCVASETDIYIFKESNQPNQGNTYKYDTLTNMFT